MAYNSTAYVVAGGAGNINSLATNYLSVATAAVQSTSLDTAGGSAHLLPTPSMLVNIEIQVTGPAGSRSTNPLTAGESITWQLREARVSGGTYIDHAFMLSLATITSETAFPFVTNITASNITSEKRMYVQETSGSLVLPRNIARNFRFDLSIGSWVDPATANYEGQAHANATWESQVHANATWCADGGVCNFTQFNATYVNVTYLNVSHVNATSVDTVWLNASEGRGNFSGNFTGNVTIPVGGDVDGMIGFDLSSSPVVGDLSVADVLLILAWLAAFLWSANRIYYVSAAVAFVGILQPLYVSGFTVGTVAVLSIWAVSVFLYVILEWRDKARGNRVRDVRA